ncbi:TnsA endonuclease N-terminal domain-containing protein [Janthinobacterium sp. AD80]|uniref:TnsA endonuclease N-terminal domain-containing protein n=1 Tax=Janthinobacterium sp. AD80 TaxID=1528773 RepID=UPI0011AFB636|nr:TnsA endonuclease N-terminal domain-containing protein [Janthinobacterium sp. AD80]
MHQTNYALGRITIKKNQLLSDGHTPFDSNQLFNQIEAAFSKPPDVANVRHGQRQILQGGRGRRTSLLPSRKNGGSMPMESRLELAYALVLEASSTVVQYRTQAVQITLGSDEFAVPDFLIKTVHGKYLVHEVKPSKHHLKPEDLARFTRIKAYLTEMEIGFSVIDATELPSVGEVQELLALYAQGHRRHYTPGQIDLAYSLLKHQETTDLSKLRAVLIANALPPDLANYLQFHGRLISDVTTKPGGHHEK